jgi:hypothetical protein
MNAAHLLDSASPLRGVRNDRRAFFPQPVEAVLTAG